MDEDLRDLLSRLTAHREAMHRLREHIAPYSNLDIPEALRKNLLEDLAVLDQLEADLIENLNEDSFHDYYKPGTSLVWTLKGKYREQTWNEFKQRVLSTQGGIGIAADDFREMLRYRSAPFGGKTLTLRDAFADLTRDATELDDIQLLTEILNYMLRNPRNANYEGGWFIYYLEGKGTRDIDLERAVAVINLLHAKHPYAASVLCQTLSEYYYGPDQELVIDQLLNTGRFSASVIKTLRGVSLHPPTKGERKFISLPQLFLSYDRDDDKLMQKVRSSLTAEGFKTWTDEMIESGTVEWQAAIEQSIRESGALVVILTPKSRQSTWVRRELLFASMQYKKIFPILADGDESTSVPIELVMMQLADIRADYHSGMSGLTRAIRHYFIVQSSTESAKENADGC